MSLLVQVGPSFQIKFLIRNIFFLYISTQRFKVSSMNQSNKPPVGGFLFYVRHGLPDIQSCDRL